MNVITGNPFDLGPAWDLAIKDSTPDWEHLFEGYIAVSVHTAYYLGEIRRALCTLKE